MRRVTIQVVVVAAVTVAFVLTALSGLVLYVPGQLLPAFGISLLTWRVIHDWGALVLTAAVVVHLVLHRRRVGQMIAGLVRPARSPQSAPAPAVSPSHDPAEQVSAAVGDDPAPRFTRRRLLVLGAGAAAAALIAFLGLERRGGGSTASGPEDFPVLNIESGPPSVAAADWVVTVDGLVDSPQRLDRAAWLALPHTHETRDFHCVEGWSVGNLGWKGVRVADLLDLAKPQPGGKFVSFHTYDGAYLDSLPLFEAQAPETLLADALDGKPLPPAHGGPLRLVIPSQLGYKNVKWVVRVEVTAERAEGYWESRGYPPEAAVR